MLKKELGGILKVSIIMFYGILKGKERDKLKDKLKVFIFLMCLLLSAGVARAEGNVLKGHHLGKWKIDFGADERLRGEYKEDFDFNKNKKDSGSLIFHRLKLNSSAALGDKYELFLEGMDLQVGNHRLKKPDQADDFDLHQAYFRMNDVAGLPFDVKLGRQEMKYGKGRLIWAATWSNRINHFDAGVLHYKDGGFYADLISGLRVGYDNNNFNRPNTHDMINGIYAGYQKDKQSPLIEPYFLANIDAEDLNNLKRFTTGFRLQANLLKDITFDLEVPYQFGRDKGKSVSAYAIHFDAGRSFDIPWKPKVNLAYNLASGDRKAGDSKTNTFIPLYQSTHDPYGIMDFFRWENMQEAAVEVTLNPHKKWKIIPATNFFWLESDVDSWYDSSGKKLRTDTTGGADSFVGQEASLVIKYDLNDSIKIDSGYAHFFTGPYVKDTGTHNDADWLYLQFNIKI